MDRRTFCAIVGATAIGSFYQASPTTTIEVGLYLSKTARDEQGSDRLNEIAHTVDNVIQTTFDGPGYEYHVGPHTVIDTASAPMSDAQSTWTWWKDQPVQYDHANVLVLSDTQTEWADHGGYADIGGPHAVVNNYTIQHHHVDWLIGLTLHEVGHCLNATHDQAVVGEQSMTAMGNERGKRRKRRYSTAARQSMKRFLD